MMIGGLKHIKAHPEEGGSPANVFMEVLLGKSVECLAHTISYAQTWKSCCLYMQRYYLQSIIHLFH